MDNKPSRRVPDEKAATQDEIMTAIQCLSDAENLRLQKYARFRIRGLGKASAGRDWRDLVGEALTATLDPDHRRWNKSVTFVRHLLGAMRSISTAWRKAFDPDEADLESDLIRPGQERKEGNVFADIPSANPGGERIVMARQEVDAIEKLFARDSIALDVIGGWRAQMTGPDIKEALGISQTEYETVVKRIRRTVQSAASISEKRT
jgi:hypothetical protein